MYPSADQVARAVVAACRLTGDGPMATCMRQPSRARNIAMQVLMDRFPDAKRQTLARLVGYPKPVAGTSTLAMARKSAWWRDEWVDDVKAAIDEVAA